jgi:tricorn protease
LLNGTVDETIVITVIPRDAKDPLDVKSRKRYELNPVPRDRLTNLFYERWVSANARQVEKLSNGKLGYIHIPSMDEAGLDRFVRALYSENFGKEALVLDVRFNGGGFTHDQILNYLGAREHTIFQSREGGKGLVLRSYDRKWTKPIILLINNRSYSDAEIFPSAFKTLGLGKLVGQPTGGMVIGTVNTKLLDGSSFRLPRLGVYTSDGIDMDTRGVKPDFLVEPTVDELLQGKDSQLEKAVEELSRQLQSAGDQRQQPKK